MFKFAARFLHMYMKYPAQSTKVANNLIPYRIKLFGVSTPIKRLVYYPYYHISRQKSFSASGGIWG